MAVEMDGNVRMRGDTGPGVMVRVLAEKGRLRLVSGNELVGDWMVTDLGVSALQDGFNIKAEGEEFLLRTDDDVALAEEIGVTAASPRLARRLAARHNPEEPAPTPEPPQISSNLAAVGFAVAGALVVLGGVFLDLAGGDLDSADLRSEAELVNGGEFWLAFVIGGALMIAVAFVMSMGARLARAIATVVLLGMVVVFGFAVSGAAAETTQVTAYGFIAGGLVVGVAVLSSGSLRRMD
ncbi:MAG TPA: hypothetical protein VF148_18975 [Acidimicrobiia bacterium]